MRILLLILSIVIPISAGAAVNFPLGARFAGMANSCVVMQDIWCVAHNQAGLAYLPNATLSAYHENRFFIKEYNLSALAIAVPTKPGTFAVSYSFFGYSKYHEAKAGLAYSKSFGEKLSCGIQLDYFSKFIQNEYGRGRSVAVEGGILYQPVKNFYAAFHVFNPNGSKISEYNNERLPTIVRFGLGYHFKQKVTLVAETEKQTHIKAYYKFGMEYAACKTFFFRAGISNNPLYAYSFGFGMVMKKIIFDIASSYHQVLGFTPFSNLTFTF